MSPIALLLVTISTISHALWKYMGKKRSPTAAFFEMTLLAATICLSPILLLYIGKIPFIPVQVWGMLLLTGICQSIYFWGLASAYRNGQLSIAYPLARSLPILIVTFISVIFSMGSPISVTGYLGIFLVVLGCLFIPLQSFRSVRLGSYLNLYCGMALVAACGTAVYTLIDNEALQTLRSLPEIGLNPVEMAILYMVLETAITAIVLGFFVLISPAERQLFQEIQSTTWRYAAVTGVIINITYALVLVAMAFVTNVSYVAAFRELSIPIGAILGISLQKEPPYRPKMIGVGIVLAGLLLVGLT
jgi:drug/metabolite transporter (DMT)-like permease